MEYLSYNPEGEEALTNKDIEQIEYLLMREANDSRKTIYAKLITLLPHPRKEQLLPYIEDSSLSIVCINILLGGDKIAIETMKLTTKDSIKGKETMKSSLKNSKKSINLPDPIPLNK